MTARSISASPGLAELPRILADLMAGLGGEEAALYRTLPGEAPFLLGLAGRPGLSGALPALADGGVAQATGGQAHLGFAAAAIPGGMLTLAVRRSGAFTEAELRLVRSTVRALALSHN
jgi:hypothetical protein